MELVRIDTQRAYELIREKITSLELAPGSPIDEGSLSKELNMGLVPVREALNLLAHDHLVDTHSLRTHTLYGPSTGVGFQATVHLASLDRTNDYRVGFYR